MSTFIEIKGIDELERKLGRLASVEILKLPTEQGLGLLFARTQIYPPPAHRKMRWKTEKQRRWFFANLHKGKIQVPYRRRKSGGLAGRWAKKVKVEKGTVIGILSNRISYGPWVMGPHDQAAYHKGVWPTTKDIARLEEKHIARNFTEAIRRAIE